MICKACGAENERPVFEAVGRPAAVMPAPDAPPKFETLLKRWACWACGRYHLPDGRLWESEAAVARTRDAVKDVRNVRKAMAEAAKHRKGDQS